jgi:hypothetical protein
MSLPESTGPNWDLLFETAAGQSGYVTTKLAAEAGYSTHLLRKHIHAGRVTRPPMLVESQKLAGDGVPAVKLKLASPVVGCAPITARNLLKFRSAGQS